MKKILLLVALTLGLAACGDSVYAANLLFKSNFGSGVYLEAPTNYFGTGAWQRISGKDSETGYTWPGKIGGGLNEARIQSIVYKQVPLASLGDYIESTIRQVPEYKVAKVKELFVNVKDKGGWGKCCAQAPLIWTGGWKSGDVKELYTSYWFKHPANLKDLLSASIPGSNWIVQTEYKTGGYMNAGGGDHRVSTQIMIDENRNLYWVTKADNNANASPPLPFQDYWRQANTTVPVPLGEYFRFEVYWNRSAGPDGRHWVAVNGQVIADYKGSNMGEYKLPVTRLMLVNPYSGGDDPVQARVTGIEFWDTWPCGVGKSCY